MADWKKGDKVFVKKLGRDGVVTGFTEDKKVEVAFGVMTLKLKPSELAPPKADKWKNFSGQGKKSHYEAPKMSASQQKQTVLDLHGKRVEEALRMVESFINQAILSGHDSVQILHGLGTGALMTAVHAYLKSCPVVKRYALDEQNPAFTQVYF